MKTFKKIALSLLVVFCTSLIFSCSDDDSTVEPVLTPSELLASTPWETTNAKNNKNEKMLESPERMVYSCLDLFPKGIDELMKETELSISELMERLITLELKGYAEEVSRNYYIRLQ